MPDDLNFDITANDKASDVVDDLTRKVRDLEGEDVTVDVDVDTADAAADMDRFADKAERADKAARGMGEGSKVGGNAVADLAGPLGNAEGAASTAGGVFDGLGDIVEGIAPKLGLTEQAAANVATGLGLVGLAVAGIAAAYTAWTDNQKKAAEQAKRTAEEAKKLADAQRSINDALREGDNLTAAQTFLETYQTAGKNIPAIARQLGISVGEATDAILNQADTAPILAERLASLQTRIEAAGGDTALRDNLIAQRAEAIGAAEQLGTLSGKYVDLQGGAAGAASTEQQVADALERSAGAAHDATVSTQELMDIRRAAADASFALRDAQDDFTDATRASTEAAAAQAAAIREHGASSTEAAAAAESLAEAQESERRAAVAAGDAAVALAQHQAEQFGVTLKAEDAQRVLNESLIASARTATPEARAQIEQYIAQVNNIPPEKATEIVASATGVDQAAAELDHAARPRTTTITVDDIVFRDPVTGQRTHVPLAAMAPAAPVGPAGPVSFGRGAAPAAAAFPIYGGSGGSVNVTVDARGAADPYAIGRTIREHLTAWGRVAGVWRPGAGFGEPPV